MPTNNFLSLKSKVSGMRRVKGASDELIINQLIDDPSLDEKTKSAFQTARDRGLQTRVIDDLLKIEAPIFTEEETTKEAQKIFGERGGRFLTGAARFLGPEKLGRFLGGKLGSLIFPEQRKEIERLRGLGLEKEAEMLRTRGVTRGQAIGSGIRTLATALPVGVAGGVATATRAGRLTLGAATGAGIGAGEALEERGGIGELLKGAATGAITGLVVSAGAEALGSIFRKIGNIARDKPGTTLNRAVQPKRAELAKDIERNFKTFGQEAADILNDKGKPLYVGNLQTLKSKAEIDLSKTKPIVEKAMKDLGDTITATPEELATGLREKLVNNLGKLTKSQEKMLTEEINRMKGWVGEKLNAFDMLTARMKYDDLIYDNFWTKIDDPTVALRAQIRYFLRDNLRRVMNEIAPLVKESNRRMSIAMDMKKFVSNMLAGKQLQKVTGSIAELISRTLEKTLLAPAVTTRATQFGRRLLGGAGQRVGQTPARQLGRVSLIRGMGELTE
jgi:hypothetical protein